LRKYGGGILVTRRDFFLDQNNNVCGLAGTLLSRRPAQLPDPVPVNRV